MTTHHLEPTARRSPGLVSVDGRTYPLRAAKLTTDAANGIAFSRLTQRFANPYDEPLEVVYTLPLPADGAVIGYTVRMGERTIRGVVEPREKASADYTRALAEGRTAGLLEQDRDDTFQQRLGNLPPGVEAEIEIQVLHPLAFVRDPEAASGPQWEFRFPTVVGVRYQGEPGRVEDARRLDVDRDGDGGIPVRLALALTVGDPTAAKITSPTHGILTHGESGHQSVEFAQGERLDRDLVIRWGACTNECGARLAIGGGVEGDSGRYGLLTVTPPELRAPAFTRDLTVLLDASGSMHGEPIAWAKGVVKELLESLEPGDRFELLAFANRVERLGGPMRFATPDAVERALRALQKLEAGGGTEMTRAVTEALRPLRKDSQRQVVLVTDGYIGFEDEVMTILGQRLPPNCRAHVVGIGAAPNRTLTAGVARAGRGVEVLVGHAAGLGAAARRLCAATAAPILTEVSLAGSAVKAAATTRLHDVFAGQPLLALVELGVEAGTLEVSARRADAAEPWTARVDVPAAGSSGASPGPSALPLGALFGREVIADLELSATSGARAAAIEDEIEAAAMRHRITSRRTSLVAIAEEPSVDPNGERRSERLAVELPAGVSADGSGLFGSERGATLFHARSVFQMPPGAASGRAVNPDDDGEVLRHPRWPISEELASTFARTKPARVDPVRRRLDSLRDLVRQGESLALRLRWLAERERGADDEVAGLIERDANTLAEIRGEIDTLRAALEVFATPPDEAIATPAWAAPLARLTEKCERLLKLAEGLARSGAKREGAEDSLRMLYEGQITANLAAMLNEIAGIARPRAELP